jgi:pimeloyl-ACP methyl ester carboxylesterase
MRRVVELGEGSVRMVGTYHHPRSGLGASSGLEGADSPAFLFLNSGHMPRDGHASLVARMAEHVARLGYPSFRLDLPGLGDSPGQLPESLESLFQMMHDGCHVEPALAAARDIRRRYGFDTLVLGGLCAAAGTSLLAAARSPECVAGIVALELELFRPVAEVPLELGAAVRSRAAWLRLLTGHSRLNRVVPPIRGLVPGWLGRMLLPAHTDRPLVDALADFVARQKPLLLMMSAGNRRAAFFDQVRGVVLGRRAARSLRLCEIPGTNHIFTTGAAHEVVLERLGAWSREHFRPCLSDPVDRIEPFRIASPEAADLVDRLAASGGRG